MIAVVTILVAILAGFAFSFCLFVVVPAFITRRSIAEQLEEWNRHGPVVAFIPQFACVLGAILAATIVSRWIGAT